MCQDKDGSKGRVLTCMLPAIRLRDTRSGILADLQTCTFIEKNPNRKTLLKLRISNRKLLIETGRYNNIPRSDRLCTSYLWVQC